MAADRERVLYLHWLWRECGLSRKKFRSLPVVAAMQLLDAVARCYVFLHNVKSTGDNALTCTVRQQVNVRHVQCKETRRADLQTLLRDNLVYVANVV